VGVFEGAVKDGPKKTPPHKAVAFSLHHSPQSRPKRRNLMTSLAPILFKAKSLILIFVGLGFLLGLVRLVPNPSVAKAQDRALGMNIAKNVPIKIKLKKDKEASFKDLKNEKWLREFELQVENTGDRPIYFLHLMLIFPDTKDEGGYPLMFPLYFGRPELGDIQTKASASDVPIMPGEEYVFKIHPTQVPAWESSVKEGRFIQPHKVEIKFQILSFGDGTGFVGPDGEAVPRIPQVSSKRCPDKVAPADPRNERYPSKLKRVMNEDRLMSLIRR
jgi:hypothetical protein